MNVKVINLRSERHELLLCPIIKSLGQERNVERHCCLEICFLKWLVIRDVCQFCLSSDKRGYSITQRFTQSLLDLLFERLNVFRFRLKHDIATGNKSLDA